MFAELYGRVDGYCHGKGGSMHIADMSHGMLGANGIVGAAVNIGTGAAFAAKYRGEKKVSVSFFGDASTNRGTFHEALNLAAIWELPAVYICENNLYGVANYQPDYMKLKDVADRAASYGFPGVVVDGNDVAGRPRSGRGGGGAGPQRRRPHPRRGQDLAPLGPLHRRHAPSTATRPSTRPGSSATPSRRSRKRARSSEARPPRRSSTPSRRRPTPRWTRPRVREGQPVPGQVDELTTDVYVGDPDGGPT